MQHDFKIGDIVALRSGSTDMTVVTIGMESVTVQFTGVDERLHTAQFHHKTLVLIQPLNGARLTADEQAAYVEASDAPTDALNDGEPSGDVVDEGAKKSGRKKAKATEEV